MFTEKNPKYREALKRAKELLSKMTLEEKVIQLTQHIGFDNSYNPESKDKSGRSKAGRCGSLLAVSGKDRVNEIEKTAVAHTPKGIPVITGNDVIHGYYTTMPIPLALAGTFDGALVRRCFATAGEEAKAEGVHWVFSPMVDVARDSRWGRVAEGFGEDPYLASIMAEAAVRGYQDDAGIMACLKHFVGYSAAEGGRDYNTCQIDTETLFNTFLPPFAAGVKAGCATVMASFNTVGGIPMSGNREILTDVLRGRLGFDGFVVSDYDSVHELVDHGFAEDLEDAALKGYSAGVDVVMSGELYNDNLPRLVREGKISEDAVNASVLRVLAAKYLIGVMDEPFVRGGRAGFDGEALDTALEAAINSAILLENDGILPITEEKLKNGKIALVGPGARDREELLGCWASCKDPNRTVTIEEGLRKVFGDSLVCEPGLSYDGTLCETDKAVEAARGCDVILVAVGERAAESGEATGKTNLDLDSRQLRLIEELSKTGVPTVLLITAGRPLALGRLKELANAILWLWAPGTMAGDAVASLISGRREPSGRCAISFPRSAGQCPIYYNCKTTGRPANEKRFFTSKYIDCPTGALYPFGYGLSYTDISYEEVTSDRDVLKKGEALTLFVRLKNRGFRAGSETVQLYLRDVAASVTRPRKQLIGYEKVTLLPNEEKTVTFKVTESDLSFWNNRGEKVTEPGRFILWAAENSDDDSHPVEFRLTD